MDFRVIVLLVFLVSQLTLAKAAANREDEHCGVSNSYEGKEFTLIISRTFHSDVRFKLCNKPDKKYLVIIEYTDNPKSDSSVVTENTINIESDTYARLLSLRDDALDYNTKDYSMGADGSSWCLHVAKGFTQTFACFYTPTSKSEERGLKGLADLGRYLWDLTDQEAKSGDIY